MSAFMDRVKILTGMIQSRFFGKPLKDLATPPRKEDIPSVNSHLRELAQCFAACHKLLFYTEHQSQNQRCPGPDGPTRLPPRTSAQAPQGQEGQEYPRTPKPHKFADIRVSALPFRLGLLSDATTSKDEGEGEEDGIVGGEKDEDRAGGEDEMGKQGTREYVHGNEHRSLPKEPRRQPTESLIVDSTVNLLSTVALELQHAEQEPICMPDSFERHFVVHLGSAGGNQSGTTSDVRYSTRVDGTVPAGSPSMPPFAIIEDKRVRRPKTGIAVQAQQVMEHVAFIWEKAKHAPAHVSLPSSLSIAWPSSTCLSWKGSWYDNTLSTVAPMIC